MPKISIFPQIIKLIPRSHFESIVAKYGGNRGVRKLDCWTWFGVLMFSQLSGHDSIRALERVFAYGNKECAKLGFTPVCRSTLSDANSSRPVAILEDLYKYALGLAQKSPRKHGMDLNESIFLMDSTFIKLCLSLCPWAYYRRSDKKTGSVEYAGVKLHTAIDMAGHIPEFIVIKEGTESSNYDLKVAKDNFHFEHGCIVVFDRGYWNIDYFNDLNHDDITFVTRMRNKNIRYNVEKSNTVDRTLGIKCDQHIYLSGKKTKGRYKGKLRRISYIDPETQKKLIFITNRFDLPAKIICDLYKARWQVELFFRTLKQNLKIKKFLGLNNNAVFAQIYTALIVYVLLAYLKLTTRSNISMPELMAVVGTLLLLKYNIIDILKIHPRTTRHPPPNFQLLLPLTDQFQ